MFATAPRQHWIDELRRHDVPCGPLYDIEGVFADPQVQHLGMAVEVNHPEMGRVRVTASPVHLQGTAIRYEYAPPLLGEHNAEILARCGYDAAKIRELTEAGVI